MKPTTGGLSVHWQVLDISLSKSPIILHLWLCLAVYFYIGIHTTVKGRISICTDRVRDKNLLSCSWVMRHNLFWNDCHLTDLSLKGEVSCKVRGMCKLPQLENYDLSLMQKWSYQQDVLLLMSWFWWCQRVSFDTWLAAQVQIVLTGAVEPTGSYPDTSGSHGSVLTIVLVKDMLSDTLDHYVILLQMRVFGSMYSDWIHMVPKGYVNSLAYVTDIITSTIIINGPWGTQKVGRKTFPQNMSKTNNTQNQQYLLHQPWSQPSPPLRRHKQWTFFGHVMQHWPHPCTQFNN